MKRILLSLALILGVGGAVTGVTAAYFSSTATSVDNTFGTGSMTIKLTDFDELTPASSVSMSFGKTLLAPGDVIPQQVLDIINEGNLNGDHLDMAVTLTGDTALANYIVLSGTPGGTRFGTSTAGAGSVRFDVAGWTAGDAEYHVTDGLTGNQITGPNANTVDDPALVTGPGNGMDRDGDTKVTLADLAVGKVRISSFGLNAGINAGTTAHLWINATVDPAMDDTMQGKAVTATFTWTLHQNASQF